jgi:chaperonin GroES
MSRNSLGGGDALARGARSATFSVGVAKGKADLKNVSKEGRDTTFDSLTTERVKIEGKKSVVEPLFSRVLIKTDDEEKVTAGGIVIPDEGKDRPNQGTVVAVGVGKYREGVLQAMTLKVGDRVLYGKYVGTEVKVDGEVVLMMDEEQVLARIL